MKKWIVPIVLLALSAHAEPLAPMAAPGEIIFEQHTFVEKTDRGPLTTRYFQVKMRLDGTDRVVTTPFGNPWKITDHAEKWSVEADASITVHATPERIDPPVRPLCRGVVPRLDEGVLGKRVEDGVTITGEWHTRECPADATYPAFTEREETWYRIDEVNGQKILRPHRREVTSQYMHRRVDYLYVKSSRLHKSLFDEKLP
jgi:hypothetical protein